MVDALKTTIMHNNHRSISKRCENSLVHLLYSCFNLIFAVVFRIHLNLADTILHVGIFQALKETIDDVEAHRSGRRNLINIFKHDTFLEGLKDLKLLLFIVNGRMILISI